MAPITKNLLSFLVIILNLIFSAEAKEKLTWYKGNTHTHSLWSDGNDFPEMIAKYYKDNGYHFLVLSDHNILSRGEKWMRIDSVEKRRRTLGVPTMKKYLSTYGKEWVEIRGEDKTQEVRLKTLDEIRPLFENDKFAIRF